MAAGADPSGYPLAPVVADMDEPSDLWDVHPLAAAAPLIRDCLAATAYASQHLIVVSDADGVLLWIDGDPRVRFSAADSMNFAEGALWSEPGAGTSVVGTAWRPTTLCRSSQLSISARSSSAGPVRRPG